MKKSEIGSEFWNVPYSRRNNLFPKDTQWFVSGRSALQAIIQENRIKSVALPEWCCESMIYPFIESGIQVTFYDGLNPSYIFEADAILVMDYFGYTSNNSFKDFNGIVIRDLTHSLFSKVQNDADYYFGSLRKWAGFYTGGFAWGFKDKVKYDSCNLDYISLRKKAMYDKELYITKQSISKNYLQTFSDAEDCLENIKILPSCERDISIANKIDIDFIKKTRRNNASVLLDEFSDIAIFGEIKADDCPMFVPVCVKNRDELRKFLIQKNIYCPVHWPISKYHKLTAKFKQLYDEELSLVCDQRYNEDDMVSIIDAIRMFEGR